MRGFLDPFRQGGSRVKSRELVLVLVLKLTSEASRELKAAASLEIPAVLVISALLKEPARQHPGNPCGTPSHLLTSAA